MLHPVKFDRKRKLFLASLVKAHRGRTDDVESAFLYL